MVSVAQVISDLVVPVLGVLGVVLRALGGLGAGLVAGIVLRHAVDFKVEQRFYVPLIFLGTVLLFAFAASGTWSSPGTIAALGIGLFVGYQLMHSAPQSEQDQSDDD